MRLAFIENKRVAKIILTGGRDPNDSVSEALAAKRFAMTQGIPESDLLIEDKSQSTYENLAFTKEIASRRGLKSFLIVSDPLHMRRALDIANDLGMDSEPSPTTTSRYVSAASKRDFLKRELYFLLKYRLYERFTLD